MTKVVTNFTEQKIYVGLDVHKLSWNAALYLNDQYLRNEHQPPSPPDKFNNGNWSKNFLQWLSALPFDHASRRVTLDYMIREMELLRKELLSISNDIRKLMRSKAYKKLFYLLRTITGIGPLTAALLITLSRIAESSVSDRPGL